MMSAWVLARKFIAAASAESTNLGVEAEAANLEVANIAREALGAFQPVVHLPAELQQLTPLLHGEVCSRELVRHALAPIGHLEVPVPAYPLEMGSQRIGQLVGTSDTIVLSPVGALAHRLRHLPCLGRHYAALFDPLQHSLYNPTSGGGIDRGVRPAVELLGLDRGCEDERESGGEGWAHRSSECLRIWIGIEGYGAPTKTLEQGCRLRLQNANPATLGEPITLRQR
jgi:hypothetical protein